MLVFQSFIKPYVGWMHSDVYCRSFEAKRNFESEKFSDIFFQKFSPGCFENKEFHFCRIKVQLSFHMPKTKRWKNFSANPSASPMKNTSTKSASGSGLINTAEPPTRMSG